MPELSDETPAPKNRREHWPYAYTEKRIREAIDADRWLSLRISIVVHRWCEMTGREVGAGTARCNPHYIDVRYTKKADDEPGWENLPLDWLWLSDKALHEAMVAHRTEKDVARKQRKIDELQGQVNEWRGLTKMTENHIERLKAGEPE